VEVIHVLNSTGNALLGERLEVEYNRINLDGSTEYLGWIKGYLVNFEDGDLEWQQSVEEQNVQLLDNTE